MAPDPDPLLIAPLSHADAGLGPANTENINFVPYFSGAASPEISGRRGVPARLNDAIARRVRGLPLIRCPPRGGFHRIYQ